ncbi:MAG TPA: alpha/beta hydrolase [Solirubrobacteraceae bacterium]|jgi:pimeloyl-ACP methyl ester carboxylesterase|nr:alpha/beta hydrolase [Solirubrobacteraceae bacterium]
MARRLHIATPDCRRLDVEVAGPEDGRAVVAHAGTPGNRSVLQSWVAAGAKRGLFHVGYSRPGYGQSDREAGRTVADCAADVAAIADALGFERFFSVGQSGGGPHSLACAALLPDRTIAAATLAGVAPHDAEGLDWSDGMGAENIEEFGAMEAGEEQLRAYLEEHGAGLASASATELHTALGDLLSAVDAEVLTGEFAEYLAASVREGLEHGLWGWFDDDVAFGRPWGFELGAITRPVAIWQGAQDRFVPFAHGEWLAAHVAGARARLLPDHGHLSIAVGSYDAVLDDLIAIGD